MQAGKKLRQDTLTQKSHPSKLGLHYLVHICRKFSKSCMRGRNFDETAVSLFAIPTSA